MKSSPVVRRRRVHRALGWVGLMSIIGSLPASAQVRAFPEAEGFGRFASGARTNLASASVYRVTNLNDSGAGSFRDAVSQSNRFVVFDVGGIATINSVVTVASNITIAGQTAPGGFTLYGNRVAFHNANNLISRHFAIRNASTNNNDAASLARGQNMIWDHMSITWGVDGTFDINPDSGFVVDNLTIQNSIIAQGLQVRNHSTGGLMTLEQDRNLSIIRSLFADNKTRNPKARGNTEFINNVLYGWTTAGYIMGDTVNAIGRANAEGNYFIAGPLASSGPFNSGTPQYQIFGTDNLHDSNRNGLLDGALITSYPGATVMASRHNFPTTASMAAPDAVEFVLDHVGPSIIRDVVDTHIINNVASFGTQGGLINRETDLYPNFGTDPQYRNPRAKLLDADNDGIPDNWERSRGLNPNNAADWRNLVNGYAQIEHYVNELGAIGTIRTGADGAWTSGPTWGGVVPTFADTAIVTGGVQLVAGHAFARRVSFDGASAFTGGTLDVFDTLLVGAGADGSLDLAGASVGAGRVVLGTPGRSAVLSLQAGAVLQTGTVESTGGTASLVFDGGTFNALASPLIAVPVTIGAGGATINTRGFDGSITGGLSGTGTLVKTGAGTLVLSGNNSQYLGNIIVNAGQVTLATNAANSSTGVMTLASGTQINIATSGASTPIAIASNATATITAGGLTFGGAIQGDATATLNVSNASSGTSNFSLSGSLANFAGTLNLVGPGNIRIGSTGGAQAHFNLGNSTGTIRTTFDGTVHFGSISGGPSTRLQGSTNGTNASTYVIGARGVDTTFAGVISDGTNAVPARLNITKVGPGILILSGANTYSGLTTVEAGTLRLGIAAQVPVLSGAGVDIRGGRLVFDYAAGSTLPATLIGLLTASDASDFASGQIRSSTATDLDRLGWIDVPSAGQFIIAAVPAGDANLDNVVSFGDLLVLAQNYGQSGRAWATGDFTYDGVVNFDDLLRTAQNYTNASLLHDWHIARALVPEPAASLVLVASWVCSSRVLRPFPSRRAP